MAREAEGWLEVDGEWYCERSDATDSIFEKNIIEARYNWAISRLSKHRDRVRGVLDVGCALGYGTNLIYRAGFEVEGIDKSEIAIEFSRKRYPHIKFITGEFPKRFNRKYDAIVANEVIEHVADYEGFISSCFELLPSGGLLMLTTPNRKYTNCRNPHHVHEFTLQELRKLVPTSKIRAFSSRLVRGQRFLSLFMRKEQVQRFMFLCSKLPVVYQMPQYARYFLVEVAKD